MSGTQRVVEGDAGESRVGKPALPGSTARACSYGTVKVLLVTLLPSLLSATTLAASALATKRYVPGFHLSAPQKGRVKLKVAPGASAGTFNVSALGNAGSWNGSGAAVGGSSAHPPPAPTKPSFWQVSVSLFGPAGHCPMFFSITTPVMGLGTMAIRSGKPLQSPTVVGRLRHPCMR